jgi:hypothetical protein
MHLSTRTAEPQSLGAKVHRIVRSGPKLLPVLVALLGAAAGGVRRVGWVGMLVAWLLATLAVDLEQGPLFIHHLVVLSPPIALLGGAAPRLLKDVLASGPALARPATTRAVGGLAVLLAVGLGLTTMTSPLPREDSKVRPAITAINRVVAPGAYVVSDEPFAAAWTGHPTAPNLVDVSLARISSGNLTTADVEAGTEQCGARAVIFSTGRLKTLNGYRDWVMQRFRLAYEGRHGLQVWVRDHN